MPLEIFSAIPAAEEWVIAGIAIPRLDKYRMAELDNLVQVQFTLHHEDADGKQLTLQD